MTQPNIKDIAAKAGVCLATVSRTLRTPEIVKPQTRQKVLAVIDEMGYSPNSFGAGLRSGKSRNIVVITPDISNPYFSPIVRAIEKVAMEKGYSVLLGDSQEDPILEQRFGNMLRTKQADGIIICSSRLPFDVEKNPKILDNLPPLVSTAEVVPYENVHKVVIDNVAAGMTGINHLLELGHTRFGILAGEKNHKSTLDRIKGCKAALKQAGLTLENSQIIYTDYSSEAGVTGVQTLLQAKVQPTAFFCFCDIVAIGVIHGLHNLGFKIPEEKSVVGLDNISIAEYISPSLTTVAQPMEDIGTRCATTLLDIIDGKPPATCLDIVPHRLIKRASSGPAT